MKNDCAYLHAFKARKGNFRRLLYVEYFSGEKGRFLIFYDCVESNLSSLIYKALWSIRVEQLLVKKFFLN